MNHPFSILFLPVFLVTLSGCGAGSKSAEKQHLRINRYSSAEDTLSLPFDTARVLALYDYRLSDLSANAPADLDTFVLYNMMYACDCPSWATRKERETIESTNVMDPDVARQHDIFYIERGDKQLSFPDAFFQTEVRFFGKIRTRSGLPDEGLMDPSPSAGPVLTVYGYEVLLPAVIYGPFVYQPDSLPGAPEWAKYGMTTLVITPQNAWALGSRKTH